MKPEYEPLDEIRKCKTIQGIVDFLRERAAYCAQNMGNAAAMREALARIVEFAKAWADPGADAATTLGLIIDKAESALSAPARNCECLELPTDSNGITVHISDRVHMLNSDSRGDHE